MRAWPLGKVTFVRNTIQTLYGTAVVVPVTIRFVKPTLLLDALLKRPVLRELLLEVGYGGDVFVQPSVGLVPQLDVLRVAI